MNPQRLNRRRFLSTSGRTTAALATGSAWLASRTARAQSPNDKVVLALIGAGGRAAAHASGMSKLPGVEFKYVCDVWTERGGGIINELAATQGRAPRRISDMRVAFEDPDVNAVVIATPEHWHALATVWACQAGKDVYVEKNPSMTIWEGRKMIEAARKYGRIVQVGFQNRSGPYAATARDYIASGKLGRIVHVKVYNLLDGTRWEPVPDAPAPTGLDWDAWLGPAPEVPYNPGRHRDWHPYWAYKGGTLADDASHQLDLARMALGDPGHPKSVLCVGGNHAFQSQREVPEFQCITYDFGEFTMTCESGNATGYMRKFPGEVRYGDKWPHWPTSATRIEIYGTKALMYLGRHGCGWQVVVEGGKVIDQDKGYFPDKWHQPNFIDCVRSRKEPNADIARTHPSACLVHLANTSYRVGKRQLDFDGATERFTHSDDANALLKPAYRKHYRIPDVV
jgi:predicted dehydrogenase